MPNIHPLYFALCAVFAASGLTSATAAATATAATVVATAQPTNRPTRTIENLREAIQGEANAAARYDAFAKRADSEGYAQVAKLFRAAAESERIHRRNHETVMERLGEPLPQVQINRVAVGSTRDNLQVPIKGERNEADEMYPKFISQAEKDDVAAAARSFKYARDAEAEHLKLFEAALRDLGKNPGTDYFVEGDTGMVVERPSVAPDPTKPWKPEQMTPRRQ